MPASPSKKSTTAEKAKPDLRNLSPTPAEDKQLSQTSSLATEAPFTASDAATPPPAHKDSILNLNLTTPQTMSGLVGDGQLVPTADNPVPPTSISGYFDGQDHARIRYARWEADETAIELFGARGTVCVFTGRSEFIERYFETIEDLRQRGYCVAIMDWRGQGRSARPLGNPRKGHITTFDQYHGDMVNFMQDIVLPDCRPPYFALAHSMGSTILLHAAAQKQPWFQRMVLVAPMLRLGRKWASTRGLRRMAEIACYVGLDALFVPGGGSKALEELPFSGNELTSDQKRFVRNAQIVRAAPELAIGGPTIGWLHAAGRAMEAALDPEFPNDLHTPILMVGAGNDTVVSTRTIDYLGKNIRGGGSIVIDGARHEILMERDRFRELFWAAFDAFIPGTDAHKDETAD